MKIFLAKIGKMLRWYLSPDAPHRPRDVLTVSCGPDFPAAAKLLEMRGIVEDEEICLETLPGGQNFYSNSRAPNLGWSPP